jgi:transcription elongation factor Elf1
VSDLVSCVLVSHAISTDVAFTCIFCNHDKSVTVRVDKKESVAHLVCRVCDQRFQTRATRTFPPTCDTVVMKCSCSLSS